MYKLGLAAAAAAMILTGCGNGGSASPISSANASAETPAQTRLPEVDTQRLNALAARAAQSEKGGLVVPPGQASAITKSTSVTTKALQAGWNAFQPVMCLGAYSEKTFYVSVVAADETMLIVVDPSVIAMLAPACVDDGKPIAINVISEVSSGLYAFDMFATLNGSN